MVRLNGPILSGGLPGYIFSLDFRDDGLYLLYRLGEASSLLPLDSLKGNSRAVGEYLVANAPLSTLALLTPFTGEVLNEALVSLSPSANGLIPMMAGQVSFSMDSLLHNHIDKVRSFQNPSVALLSSNRETIPGNSSLPQGEWTPWTSLFGQFAGQGFTTQTARVHYNSEGIFVGADYQGVSQSLVGAAVGYAHTHYYQKSGLSRGNTNSYIASFYGTGKLYNFYISPSLLGAVINTHNERFVFFPGYSQTALSSITAFELLPTLEFGYLWERENSLISPFTSASLATLWQRSYTEKGASPFNAHQAGRQSNLSRSETGVKFQQSWKALWGSFYLKEKLSYVFEKPSNSTFQGNFVGMPGSFTVYGMSQKLNLASFSLDAFFAIGLEPNPFLFSLGYTGEAGKNLFSHQIEARFSKKF